MIATCTPSVNQARTRHLANDASVTVRVSSALLVRLTFFRSADRVPSRADNSDTRTYEARGAEAPRQRTARGRLLRGVGRPCSREIVLPLRTHLTLVGVGIAAHRWVYTAF